jgi:hypothetical protein
MLISLYFIKQNEVPTPRKRAKCDIRYPCKGKKKEKKAFTGSSGLFFTKNYLLIFL